MTNIIIHPVQIEGPELGNMLFGNSRGEYLIKRGVGFEDELFRLFEAYAPKRDNSWREYGEEFDNEIFSVMPYYWGDCECGYDEKEYNSENSHSKDCRIARPNFLYKPTGFEIQWYKYPLRDSYSNKKITLKQFKIIIEDCIRSIK